MSTVEKAKFANTVLYLLRGWGDDRPGLTKLLKMLKEADFRHYRKHLRSITGVNYVAVQRGPVPDHYDSLLGALVADKAIARFDVPIEGMPKPKTEYRPLREPNERIFQESEIEVLNDVLRVCRYETGTTLSHASHDGPWTWAWDPYHPAQPIPYTLVRWLDNMCDDEDLAQSAQAIEEPETRALIASLAATA